MKKILISPYAQTLRNFTNNPKNYPWWNELTRLIKAEYFIYQIGKPNEQPLDHIEEFFYKSLAELKDLVRFMDLWISVDSFFPHFCNSHFGDSRPGIVLWSKSDPNIFGYQHNCNLLKDRNYLRANQFDIWESETYSEEAFVTPDVVITNIKQMI